MDGSTWLALGVAVVMLAGLIGTVAPLVPGLPLIWGAAFFYGWQEGFGAPGVIAMIAMSALLVAGIVAKLVLPKRRATASGAPRSTIVIGALAGIVGFFALPPFGLPLGAVAGVLVAEYRRTNEWSRAWASTKAVVIGFGIGALVEIGAGLAMIACWLVWLLVR